MIISSLRPYTFLSKLFSTGCVIASLSCCLASLFVHYIKSTALIEAPEQRFMSCVCSKLSGHTCNTKSIASILMRYNLSLIKTPSVQQKLKRRRLSSNAQTFLCLFKQQGRKDQQDQAYVAY